MTASNVTWPAPAVTVARFRWAVSQFSDDQRAELRRVLLEHGIARELVDSDLALAWLRATVNDLLDSAEREWRD